jgi:hypothetical protein
MLAWKQILSISALFGLVTFSVAQPPTNSEQTPQLDAMHPAHRAMYFVMRRGTEWLMQAQQGNGLFHPGFNAAINVPLDAPHLYHQAEAAIALAKVSRLTANQRYAIAAQQACLTLLASTKTDVKDPQLRYTIYPELSVNRAGSAGLLLRAVHELPNPADVRLAEAEGLANYLHTCQQPDGSFRAQSNPIQMAAHETNSEATNWMYEGLAVEGLGLSLNRRPAPWKMEALNHAAGFYNQQVKQMPVQAFPAFISGFAEACLRAQDKSCAAAVFNMADAVCNVQVQADPAHLSWVGGFCLNSGEKNRQEPPAAQGAKCISCLCDAYRVAKSMGDAARAEKYRQGIERGVQYYATLQYTPSSAEHFAEAFQPKVIGAFRANPTEGVVRLQDTAECVLAMATYLSDVAGVALAPAQATPSLPVPPK